MSRHVKNNPAEILTNTQQEHVIEQTRHYIQQASDYFQQPFPDLPVLFDLRGKAAGMYRVRYSQRVIRYNSFIFARFFKDNVQQTIPHEVAHYISDQLYGLRNIRPHGKEWKAIMTFFGVEANRTANYDLSGLPVRRYNTFLYQCACQNYELTSRRHNKVLRGQGHYLCRECGGKLLFVKKQDT